MRRTITRERTEVSGPSIKMMNNKQEDNRFTPKKVLVYCIIVGLTSGTLSILIDWLIVLSMATFVFASITVWYMFADKFHRWKETRRRNKI
jgi:hypothetical protein